MSWTTSVSAPTSERALRTALTINESDYQCAPQNACAVGANISSTAQTNGAAMKAQCAAIIVQFMLAAESVPTEANVEAKQCASQNALAVDEMDRKVRDAICKAKATMTMPTTLMESTARMCVADHDAKTYEHDGEGFERADFERERILPPIESLCSLSMTCNATTPINDDDGRP